MTNFMTCAGETGEIHLPHAAWLALIDLATRYGWKPRGTIRPGNWDGAYHLPVGQMISSDDCRALAAALDNALLDIPAHDARPRTGQRSPNLLELFSGDRRTELHAMVRFMEAGACLICAICPQHARKECLLFG